ncbi:polyhydroxyalkanoic acid system family protein [Parafilimonas sp.]|uniref:polyhydroxyalkanoic acid system family protein n=1 Tax=Parafilimonas sp. TaxID=1969739 RepID=UPI0039E5AD41
MSSLNLNIPHSLSKEEALTRIKNLLSNLKEEKKDIVSDVQENWQDNKGNFKFKAKGFDLAGDITVNDSNVQINSDLPFAVSFFKGAIGDMITKKTKELLA